MAEYIERKKVFADISRLLIDGAILSDYEDGISRATIDALNIIEKAPAADVRPERYGHWVVGEFNGVGTPIWCGRCGYRVSNLRDPKSWIAHPGSQYCGCCGAKMDGKETI